MKTINEKIFDLQKRMLRLERKIMDLEDTFVKIMKDYVLVKKHG